MLSGPRYEIRGATRHDQRWVDETTEAGVRALGWERPMPRPPEWDAPPPAVPLAVAAPKAAPPPKTKWARKPAAWLRMIRGVPVS